MARGTSAAASDAAALALRGSNSGIAAGAAGMIGFGSSERMGCCSDQVVDHAAEAERQNAADQKHSRCVDVDAGRAGCRNEQDNAEGQTRRDQQDPEDPHQLCHHTLPGLIDSPAVKPLA
jgi:hypothetical protein